MLKSNYQFTDLEIEPGTPETCLFSIHSNSNLFPSYNELLNGTDAKFVIELDDDYSLIFSYFFIIFLEITDFKTHFLRSFF